MQRRIVRYPIDDCRFLIGAVLRNTGDFRRMRQPRRHFPAVSGHHFIAAALLGAYQRRNQHAVLSPPPFPAWPNSLRTLKSGSGKITDLRGVQVDGFLQSVGTICSFQILLTGAHMTLIKRSSTQPVSRFSRSRVLRR